jgi:NADH:ubiquinone oxidoreductase subunit 3 (subunit A)
MVFDYLVFIFLVGFTLLLAFGLAIIPSFFVGSVKFFDSEKISPYECGFDVLESNFFEFNVQFYVVSLLFMLFDIEVMFIYPWTLAIHNFEFFEIFIMFLFLILLLLGFCFEWLNGILDWN